MGNKGTIQPRIGLGSLIGVLLLAGVVLYFTPLARILLAAGMLGQLPAEAVSHEVHVTAPEQGVSVEYGKYLVDTNDCRVCHGPDLNVGPFPDPNITKISPNLTPGGEIGFWSEEDFINAIRTGRTPSGHQMDPDFMPWGLYHLCRQCTRPLMGSGNYYLMEKKDGQWVIKEQVLAWVS